MRERHRIQERLRRKEAEIQGLEEKIKAGRVYVQALRDILKLFDPVGESDNLPNAESVLRSGSSAAQARAVILQRREPVHISDLLVALGKEPTRESRASLTSSLSAYVRRKEIFTRPAPNTFGLIELGHDSIEGTEGQQPPQGFGQSTKEAKSGALAPDEADDEIPF